MNELLRRKIIKELNNIQNWKPEYSRIAKKTKLHARTVKRFYEDLVKADMVRIGVDVK